MMSIYAKHGMFLMIRQCHSYIQVLSPNAVILFLFLPIAKVKLVTSGDLLCLT